MYFRHKVEEFTDRLFLDIATGSEASELPVVTNRMIGQLLGRRQSVALIDEYLSTILVGIAGVSAIDTLSEFPLQSIRILDTEEAHMVCILHGGTTRILPGEINLATGITEALGCTEIPAQRCGIVRAVIGAGYTISEHFLSIGGSILGEQEHHHELLVLIVDDTPLSTIDLCSIPELRDGLASGRSDTTPGYQSCACHRAFVGTNLGLRDEVATDGDETHPQVRDAGHSILLHPVVELWEVDHDMAQALIQSGAIGIHTGIAH